MPLFLLLTSLINTFLLSFSIPFAKHIFLHCKESEAESFGQVLQLGHASAQYLLNSFDAVVTKIKLALSVHSMRAISAD